MSDIIPCPWCGSTEQIAVPVKDFGYLPGKVAMCMKCKCGARSPVQFISNRIANAKNNKSMMTILIKTWNERNTK